MRPYKNSWPQTLAQQAATLKLLYQMTSPQSRTISCQM